MLTLKEALYLILLVVVIGGTVFGVKKVVEWRDGAAENSLAQPVLAAHTGLANDAAKADDDRGQIDYGVTQGRANYQSQYKEDKRHDPATADRANRAVPQRVRDNFKQRRLARERARCVGVECETGPSPAPSAERP